MKKLIFRKFLLDLFLSFCVLLFSFSVIVWVIQAVNYLDFISEDGHGFKVYFLYTLFNFPKIFSKLFLISLFISLFYIIIKYENENELSIYWSVGISKINFINKILKFSILLLMLQLIFTLYISPKSQFISKSFIRLSNIDFFPSLIKERKFIDTLSNLTIYVDGQSSNKKQLRNILIKDQNKSFNEYQIIVASEGDIVTRNNKNFLILKKGEIFSSRKNKDFSNFKFENFEINLSNFSSKTTIIPKIQENKSSNIVKCYMNNSNINREFYINKNELKCTEGSQKEIIQEIFKRFYQPFFIPVLCLIACIQLINNKFNNLNVFYKIMIFMLGIITLFTSEILIKYTGNNFAQDIIILIFPIIIFLLIYFYLLKKNYTQ